MNEIVDNGGTASPARAAIGDRVREKLNRNPLVSRIDSPHLEIYGRQDFLGAEECAVMRAIIALAIAAISTGKTRWSMRSAPASVR
jgi:prolyl 4-hydroxylase